MCKQWGVTHRFTSPYHPQVNLAERVNRNLKKMISSFVQDNHKSWDQYLQKFAYALRSSINETTKIPLSLLNLGRELPLPFDRMMQEENIADAQTARQQLTELPDKLTMIVDYVVKNIRIKIKLY